MHIFDSTYLNYDIAENFGIKYLLRVMDIFSRKVTIYGSNTKNSIILLKEFYLHMNIQKELASDKGNEFKNSIFNQFVKKIILFSNLDYHMTS